METQWSDGTYYHGPGERVNTEQAICHVVMAGGEVSFGKLAFFRVLGQMG
jgi:hypothetical protein